MPGSVSGWLTTGGEGQPTATSTSTRLSTSTPTRGPRATPTATATAIPSNTPTYTPTPLPRCPGEHFSDVCPPDYFYAAVLALNDRGAVSGRRRHVPPDEWGSARTALQDRLVLRRVGACFILQCRGFQTCQLITRSIPNRVHIQHGIISGYSDGTCRPGDSVTRAQLCKVMVLAEGWTPLAPPVPTFSDVPTDHPFYAWVETAYTHGIISGYAGGIFLPGNHATRGQICKIVYNTIFAYSSPDRR